MPICVLCHGVAGYLIYGTQMVPPDIFMIDKDRLCAFIFLVISDLWVGENDPCILSSSLFD